jgi:hypothetical protein
MGNQPSQHKSKLLPLKYWIDSQSLNTLCNISSWDVEASHWLGWPWSLTSLPANLAPLTSTLIASLKGCAPFDLFVSDRRGWANTKYSVKIGYGDQI